MKLTMGPAFSTGQVSLAAQNFNMPALSPTMTEGNIGKWKLKEGTTVDRAAPMRKCTLAGTDGI